MAWATASRWSAYLAWHSARGARCRGIAAGAAHGGPADLFPQASMLTLRTDDLKAGAAARNSCACAVKWTTRRFGQPVSLADRQRAQGCWARCPGRITARILAGHTVL